MSRRLSADRTFRMPLSPACAKFHVRRLTEATLGGLGATVARIHVAEVGGLFLILKHGHPEVAQKAEPGG